MKKSNLYLAVAMVFLSAAFSSGCVVQTVPSNSNCSSALDVTNDAGEAIGVTVTNTDTDVIALQYTLSYDSAVPTYEDDAIDSGNYKIQVVGLNSQQTLYDKFRTLDCDQTYSIDVAPYSPSTAPLAGTAELDVVNNTGDVLDVYIDDMTTPVGNVLNPGDTGVYYVTDGSHRVQVDQDAAPNLSPLLDSVDSYVAGQTYTDHIDPIAPIIKVYNDLDISMGSNAESIAAYVDNSQYPVTFTDTSNGQTYPDLLPAEVGTFTVSNTANGGDHSIDIYGETSGTEYKAVSTQHFLSDTETDYHVQ